MTARRAAICLALTLLPSSLFAQVLSEQQLDYLRQQFLEATAGSFDGSAVQENTLPVNRIQGLIPPSKLQSGIPASKLIQTDMLAYALATNAIALANFAQATANSAQTTADAAASSVSSISSEVTSLTDGFNSLSQSFDSVSNAVDGLSSSLTSVSNDVDVIKGSLFYTTTYTTNLVFPLVGQTVTLYIANGLITNSLTEGP